MCCAGTAGSPSPARRWATGVNGQDDLLNAVVGLSLTGRPTLLSVTAMTPPTLRLSGPVVGGARLESRDKVAYAEPDMSETTDSIPVADVATALRIPSSSVEVPPTSTVLPRTLQNFLQAKINERDVPRPPVRLGMQVRETWRFPNGAAVAAEYRVPAGETVGFLTDAVTGEPLRTALACRALHLTARLHVCTSCNTATCGACSDDVQPCLICGTDTCGQCRTADGRCPVCTGLRKVGLLGRLSGSVGRGNEAWAANRGTVKVRLQRIDNVWSVERTDHVGRSATPVADSQLARILAILNPES